MEHYSHLTLDERILIQEDLAKNLPLNTIASHLNKHRSTISREIRSHWVSEKKGAVGRPYNACEKRFNCTKKHVCERCTSDKRFKKCKSCRRCNDKCPDFVEQVCPLLSRPPYVCNGCGKQQDCTLLKKFYRASAAQEKRKNKMRESRTGFTITEEEMDHLNTIISPLIINKQSIHHICITNPDVIMPSERTIYRLIDAGVFTARNIDLPKKVRFQLRSCPVHKKVDKKCREGRTYQEFQEFKKENPSFPVVELDSVVGKKGGKVLLTVYFVNSGMMLAFLRDHNDSQSVIDIFDLLYQKLGHERFTHIFQVCLADNGTEFSNPGRLECCEDHTRRTRVFYCDPGRPDQKGAAERNHEFIRYFFPKGTSFDDYTQEEISLMMDHINSYCRESLGGRSPYEMFEFIYGKETLELLGCHRVPAKEVTLRKSILRKEAEK